MKLRGNLLFVFELGYLFGQMENLQATEEEIQLLRIMTPIMKLFTAKECLFAISEVIESIGAIAYMEDSNIPMFLRDAQVLTIWEGTTNILSLDFLKAMRKNRKGLDLLLRVIQVEELSEEVKDLRSLLPLA